jgi:hypothetical protein
MLYGTYMVYHDHTFDVDFFMSLHYKYDIVGFTETMKQEFWYGVM